MELKLVFLGESQANSTQELWFHNFYSINNEIKHSKPTTIPKTPKRLETVMKRSENDLLTKKDFFLHLRTFWQWPKDNEISKSKSPKISKTGKKFVQ